MLKLKGPEFIDLMQRLGMAIMLPAMMVYAIMQLPVTAFAPDPNSPLSWATEIAWTFEGSAARLAVLAGLVIGQTILALLFLEGFLRLAFRFTGWRPFEEASKIK